MADDMTTWLIETGKDWRAKDRKGLDVTRHADRWIYSGDMNLECGGLFFQPLDDDGMFRAVEVRPVSDAGGPDNKFLIQDGYLFAGADPDQWQESLDVCGYKLELIPGADGGYYVLRDGAGGRTDMRTESGWIMLADSVNGAKGFDDRQETIVQIGKDDPFWSDNRGGAWNPEADVILRGNAKLRNYVAKSFL